MLRRYLRLVAVLVLLAIAAYFNYSALQHPKYSPPLDPNRPIVNVEAEIKQLFDTHFDYVKNMVSNVTPYIQGVCDSVWTPQMVKKLFDPSSEYNAHRFWLGSELRRLETIAKERTPEYSKEFRKQPMRMHSYGEINDNSPDLPELRDYVQQMQKKVANGSISAGPGKNPANSLVLLTASHNLSSALIQPRTQWAQQHGFEHIVIDLNKYMVNQTMEQIGLTAFWLRIAAMEETMYRSRAEWIWYLGDDEAISDPNQDPFTILNNLDRFHLAKFPLQSPHPHLKGGFYSPEISTKETVFVVCSNQVALDTSSMFIRNNEVGSRYLQLWCSRINIIDDIQQWHFDDTFDGRSEEAFAHMYRVLEFLRKRTAVLPINAIAHHKS